MKLLVLLLICCCWSMCYCGVEHLPEHLQRPAQILHDACQAETNAREEDIQNSRDGKIINTREIQCYIKCLLTTVGLLDETGRIDFEGVMHMLTPKLRDRVARVTSACSTKHGADLCETAYLTIKCYFEADGEDAHLI